MRFFAIAFILMNFSFTSCTNTKKITEDSLSNSLDEIGSDDISNSNMTENTISQEYTDNDSVFAYIRRGACFGKCPVYEMTLYKSGYATYKGILNVTLIGDYKTNFSKETMEEIKEMALQVRYFSLEDKYDQEGITDLPTTKTKMNFEGKSKEIIARYGYPPSLAKYQEFLDAIAEKGDWKKL